MVEERKDIDVSSTTAESTTSKKMSEEEKNELWRSGASALNDIDDMLAAFQRKFKEMNDAMAEKLSIAFSGGFKDPTDYESSV